MTQDAAVVTSTSKSKATFKDANPLERRIQLAEKIRANYPDRVPVIVERANADVPAISKEKFLAPADISFAKFVSEIRKHISMPAEKALFCFVAGNTMPQQAWTMSHVYERYRDAHDGFLYVTYSGENTFGARTQQLA